MAGDQPSDRLPGDEPPILPGDEPPILPGDEPPIDRPVGDRLPAPPPLPARWVDIRPLVAVGTGLWFLAYCSLLVARYGYQAVTGIWLPTCLAGWVLGLVGTGIMYWQQAASRRGSRSAQHVP